LWTCDDETIKILLKKYEEGKITAQQILTEQNEFLVNYAARLTNRKYEQLKKIVSLRRKLMFAEKANRRKRNHLRKLNGKTI
jgi:hypothetical protein